MADQDARTVAEILTIKIRIYTIYMEGSGPRYGPSVQLHAFRLECMGDDDNMRRISPLDLIEFKNGEENVLKGVGRIFLGSSVL